MVGTEDDVVALDAPLDGVAAADAEPVASPEAPPAPLNIDKVDLMSDIEPLASDGQISADEARLQELLERDDDGPKTSHDDVADEFHSKTKFKLTTLKDDELEIRLADRPASIEHQALHLPYCKGCLGCDCAKMKRKYATRRNKHGASQVLQICGPDEGHGDFGTLVHCDWVEIERGTPAHEAAPRGLLMADDLTRFLGFHPSISKEHTVVIEALHTFDEDIPVIRRLWSDSASELKKATRVLRGQRPLAHYTNVPRRPTGNSKAERYVQLTMANSNACLVQAAFTPSWWVAAVLYWIACWNAFAIGPDGKTPYLRRHGHNAEYKCYPFGSLVLLRYYNERENRGNSSLNSFLM